MDDARAEYLRAVEQRFVELRGRGFMLSARDLQLVERWRQAGVPLRIVLRALEDGVASFLDRNVSGMPLPSSLAYFENQVDKAAALWRERTMSWGKVAQPGTASAEGPERSGLLEGVMSVVMASGQACEDEAIKAVLRETWRALRQSADQGSEEPWALIAALDADMVEAVEATLEDATRERLHAEAEGQLSPRGAGMSAEARKARQRLNFVALMRERVGLPDLVEVLGDVDV